MIRATIVLAMLAIPMVALPAGADDGNNQDAPWTIFDNLAGDPLGIKTCINSAGVDEWFVIKDQQPGENFQVTVLEGMFSHEIWVHFNAQIPRTHEGVNTYVEYDTWTENREFDYAITSGCGVYAGDADHSDTYYVKVDFGGTDVTVTDSQGTVSTYEVGVETESRFVITPVGAGAHLRVKFDASGTWTLTSGHTVTTHGYLKTYKGGPFHPELPPLDPSGHEPHAQR